jgi:hypothetical protein
VIVENLALKDQTQALGSASSPISFFTPPIVGYTA